MNKKIILLASSLMVVSQLSFANAIDDRQQNQRERIANGVESGELTRAETKRMAKQQVRIHAKEVQYKSDGLFTARERASIHGMQNNASKRIYVQKHDRQDRN